MKYDPIPSGKRRPVNVSLDENLVVAAREVGLKISQVSEAALRVAIKAERERRWREDNREAIEANNRWVEKHGLPLEKYRLF